MIYWETPEELSEPKEQVDTQASEGPCQLVPLSQASP